MVIIHGTRDAFKERKMIKFVNLNPHPMVMRLNAANTAAEPDAGDIVVQPRRGEDGKPAPARVATVPGQLTGGLGGVPAYGRTTFGAVEGLPAPEADTIYLVSALVGGRPEVADREDVFVPGTGPKDGVVRTSEGQIYAVTRLIRA